MSQFKKGDLVRITAGVYQGGVGLVRRDRGADVYDVELHSGTQAIFSSDDLRLVNPGTPRSEGATFLGAVVAALGGGGPVSVVAPPPASPRAMAVTPPGALVVTIEKPDTAAIGTIHLVQVPGYTAWVWTWEILEPGPSAPLGPHLRVRYTAVAEKLP